MDASRYFEEMHRAMSAQKNNSSLLLTVKVQDLAALMPIWSCGSLPMAAPGCFTPPWAAAT